ncbi:MAG: ROK family protein [Candidatus Caldatribacteriaceae bacterium]
MFKIVRSRYELMKTLTNSRMNDIHKRMVFNLIWKQKKVSRTEIRTLLGLSKSTISEIIWDFLDEGLIVENEWEGKTGGRKRGLLGVNPKGPKIISVLLKDFGTAEGALINLEGRILKRKTSIIEEKEDVRAAILKIAPLVSDLWPSHESILGLGLGVPGIVDYHKGVILYSAHFNWYNVPLREYLMKELNKGVPVIVDNRTVSATLGEKWFGEGKRIQNFICLNCGEAVGAGIVMNGEVHRGGSDGAGEVGHITIIPDGPLCFCGKKGCLESLIALPALLKELGENYKGEIMASSFLQERLRESRIQSLLRKTFTLLGEVVVIFIHLLVPEKITGEWAPGRGGTLISIISASIYSAF